MKIAFSFQNGESISGHAGHCTRFIVYSLKDGIVIDKSIVEIEKERTFHNVLHSLMLPFMNHPLFHVDVIMSASMGARFIDKMKIKGIEAIRVNETIPELAIKKYLNGELEVVEPIYHNH